MLDRFENFSNMLGMMKKYQVWQTSSNPVFMDVKKKEMLLEYVDHIHNNPVRDRIVDTACDYLYSSARDYSGMQGLVNISKLSMIDQQFVTADTTSSFFGKFIRN